MPTTDIAPGKLLLTEHDLEELTGFARATFAKWRTRGEGPAFIKIGNSVRYPADWVNEWIASVPRLRSTHPTRPAPAPATAAAR